MQTDVVENSRGNKRNLFVITVNYETPHHIENLVRSLERCDIIKKLIVVDHSYHSVCEPKSSLFPIQVIRQANRGYGAGINRGMRAVDEHDAIVFICNPDIEIVTPATMAEAVQELESNPHLACIVPSQIDNASNMILICRKFYTWQSLIQSGIGFMRRKPHMYRRTHFYMDEDLTESFDVDWGGGSSLFVKCSLFPDPLSFDEGFFLYFEDVDFFAQVHVHGYSVRYCPSVVVRHHEQKRSHKNVYFWFMHVKSLLRFIVKYRGLPQADDLRRQNPSPLTRN
jgi:GT2 family glycosyltransferase